MRRSKRFWNQLCDSNDGFAMTTYLAKDVHTCFSDTREKELRKYTDLEKG